MVGRETSGSNGRHEKRTSGCVRPDRVERPRRPSRRGLHVGIASDASERTASTIYPPARGTAGPRAFRRPRGRLQRQRPARANRRDRGGDRHGADRPRGRRARLRARRPVRRPDLFRPLREEGPPAARRRGHTRVRARVVRQADAPARRCARRADRLRPAGLARDPQRRRSEARRPRSASRSPGATRDHQQAARQLDDNALPNPALGGSGLP